MRPSRHHSILKGRFAVPSVLLLLVCQLLLASPLHSTASDETIAPDSWVYPALRTFELAGLVELAPSMPYSRSEIRQYVTVVLEAVGERPDALTPRRRFLLDRLEREFLAEDPRDREDRPALTLMEESDYAALDVSIGALFVKPADEEEGEVWGTARPQFLLGYGGMVTADVSYRLRMGPERGTNIFRSKPSSRERSFRGLTSEYEKGMLFIAGKGWRFGIGRDYVQWGSGREEGLLLSQTAGSIDHLTARVGMGRFNLHAVHAVLDPEFPRRLAGHRLTVRLPRGIRIGMSETVLYAGRDLDFAYLLPFGSYYANQYNEAGDDNILWGLDWRIPLTRGLMLYGELLVDDFQYERDPPAPDRIGFNLTAEALLEIGGLEFELLLGYTYIDIYTYAHKDTLLTSYVTGDGDTETNRIIGSPLGPDADRWNASLSTPMHPRLLFTVRGSYTRSGEGSDLREWIRGTDPRLPFPSGDVTNETRLSLEADLDLDRGSYMRMGGGWRWSECPERELDDDSGFLHIELVLDF
jgi:hypothetical protein